MHLLLHVEESRVGTFNQLCHSVQRATAQPAGLHGLQVAVCQLFSLLQGGMTKSFGQLTKPFMSLFTLFDMLRCVQPSDGVRPP